MDKHIKTVEFHEFEIEIYGADGKYYYKLWNAEKDKYEDTYHYTFTTQKAALDHAKEAIMSTEQEDYYG